MNIPNRIRAKTIFAPGKGHLAKTYPLSDPSMADVADAVTVRIRLFRSFGRKACHASAKLAQFQTLGSCHAVSRLISAGSFTPGTTIQQTGMRENAGAG